MRRNHGFLLLLSMCLTMVFIALNARSSTDLLELAGITEKRSSFKKYDGLRADNRWIARRQVKLHNVD